jgi:SAM-dependent methyltransferase
LGPETSGERKAQRPSTLESLRLAARQLYGADAAGYDAGRPEYPDELYEILVDQCGLRRGALVLEIGPGTGRVTRRVLAHGARVVAVEPDPAMADYLARACAGGDVAIIAETFEEAGLADDQFDLAIAGTSFHWVDQALGVPKLGRVVRSGGWAALWWTIFDDPGRQDPFRDAMRERLGDEDPAGQRRRSQFQLDAAARRGDLERLGGFADVSSRLIHWTARLTSAELRALYASQIEIRQLPPAEQQHVLNTVETIAAADFGGVVHRPFVTAMYTGRRLGVHYELLPDAG